MTLPFAQTCITCDAVVTDSDICPQCGQMMPK